MKHSDLIERYQNAFLARNGRPVEVTYENGWFTMGNGIPMVRKRHLEVLTKILELWAQEKERP